MGRQAEVAAVWQAESNSHVFQPFLACILCTRYVCTCFKRIVEPGQTMAISEAGKQYQRVGTRRYRGAILRKAAEKV